MMDKKFISYNCFCKIMNYYWIWDWHFNKINLHKKDSAICINIKTNTTKFKKLPMIDMNPKWNYKNKQIVWESFDYKSEIKK